MAAQCCHLADNSWEWRVDGHVEQRSGTMVHELARTITGTELFDLHLKPASGREEKQNAVGGRVSVAQQEHHFLLKAGLCMTKCYAWLL